MTTTWAVMRTEVRLAWRRRSFWIVQGLILLVGLKLAAGYWVPAIVSGFVTAEIGSLLVLELLLLPILVGPAITRDLGAAGEFLWTTSLDALRHGVGVIGGLWLALLPALVLQVGARWLIGYLMYDVRAPLFWVYGLPPLLISVSIGLGLVALLAILARRILPLLLVWVVLAMSASVWAKATSPLNLFFSRVQLSPALGLGLYRPLVRGLGLWFGGVVLMVVPLAVGVALLVDRRRAARRWRPLVLWASLAGLVMAGGYLWHSRAVAAQAAPVSPVDVQLDAWTVRAFNLHATVDVAQSTIAGSATLTLEPTGAVVADTVVLRLNPGLALRRMHDEAGRPLAAERQGDSVLVSTPVPITGSFTLHLAWEGMLRVAYADYNAGWSAARQPVRALLFDGIGYLLREGDWYPWPWTTGPHQARQSHVTLQVNDERALASAPLRDGTATWEGKLPPALLVLPPADAHVVDGFTLHVGHWPILSGPRLLDRLKSFAPATLTLARALGETRPPVHVVACPYLTVFVWSGDLLLVPEGSGYLSWERVRPAYWRGPTSGVDERAVLTVLARSWLSAHLAPPRSLHRLVSASGQWQVGDPRGRWLESEPLSFNGGVRTGDLRLTPDGQLDVLALWIAIELVDPTVRDVDLTLMKSEITSLEDWERVSAVGRDRLLFLDASVKQEFLLALHDWTLAVGRERALRLVGDVVRAGGALDLERLLTELERASGVAIQRPPAADR